MNDERAERLRQQQLMRKADAEWQTRAARWGFLRRFEREVDPERQLLEDERRERAVALRREHMLMLAAKSAAVRREQASRMGVAAPGSRTLSGTISHRRSVVAAGFGGSAP